MYIPWSISDTRKLEQLDFSEVFMVVDMQSQLVRDFLNHWPHDRSMQFYELLKANIMSQVENTLNNDWVIIIVELVQYGASIRELLNLVQWESERVVFLKKNQESLTSKENSIAQLSDTQSVLNIVNNKQASLKAGWINTSFCLLGSSVGTYDMWIQTKIPLRTTMNLTEYNFNNNNNFDNVKKVFRNHGSGYEHLLDFEDMPNDLPLLTDYLEYENVNQREDIKI